MRNFKEITHFKCEKITLTFKTHKRLRQIKRKQRNPRQTHRGTTNHKHLKPFSMTGFLTAIFNAVHLPFSFIRRSSYAQNLLLSKISPFRLNAISTLRKRYLKSQFLPWSLLLLRIC